MPIEDAWDALDDLVDLGLLQDSGAGRYRFHDLVRLFARERLQEEPQAEREALTSRVTSWLLRMATMAGRWFEPAHRRPDQPDPDLAALSSAEEAEWWLRGNVDNWLGRCGPRRAAVSTPSSWIALNRCTGSLTGGYTVRIGTRSLPSARKRPRLLVIWRSRRLS
jgi:hypothetical protein